MHNVYISSIAFSRKTPETMLEEAIANGLSIEFSSGMPHREDMSSFFLKTSVRKLLHNYFPAPRIPFVLNLASTNENIRETSIQHCISGLKLAKQAGISYFSAHAGFCIDPSPKELGQQFDVSVSFHKEQNELMFIDSLIKILNNADTLDVDFLIENNVISSFNLLTDGTNPLLCCTATEMLSVIKKVNNDRLKILLDTAHLKVSSQTLGQDVENEVELMKSHIRCIHHSDNDGITDSNSPLDMAYWFMKYFNLFQSIDHVLEVKNLNIDEIINQEKMLQTYGC